MYDQGSRLLHTNISNETCGLLEIDSVIRQKSEKSNQSIKDVKKIDFRQ